VLDVMAWGGDPDAFDWFEAPPEPAVRAAVALLERLGAVSGGRETRAGHAMRRLPLHPRLARLLIAADGARLFRQRWLPDGGAVAVVAVAHGYGEHGGRYGNLVAALVPAGFAVEVYDLRGHGRSPGPRGHVDRFVRYIGDTRRFLDGVAEDHDGTPLFLLGHSFCGLIAALMTEAPRPQPSSAPAAAPAPALRGVILSSPFLALTAPPTRPKLAAARLLSRLAPARDIGNTLVASDLSRDADVVAAYETDPLNHHAATARWAVETLSAQRRALDGAARLRLPLLVVFGSEDAIAAPAAALSLYERAGSPDKTCRCYEGYHHELFNEVGKERPIADLVAWLRARI
jgi:alpha-beta hydrolase superfamily lysophospholipase